jgi:amino acid transporter
VPAAETWCSCLHHGRTALSGPVRSAYSECMRIALVVVGVVVALFGLLWALQGFGVVGGSPMSNTTTWSIIGPIVALVGIAIAVGAARRRKS